MGTERESSSASTPEASTAASSDERGREGGERESVCVCAFDVERAAWNTLIYLLSLGGVRELSDNGQFQRFRRQ